MADSPGIVMYATGWCPYCARARDLLAARGARWTEIDVDSVQGAREQMQQRSGRRTVPQIFIGDHHVGGYDDMRALDAAGGLDALLAGVQ